MPTSAITLCSFGEWRRSSPSSWALGPEGHSRWQAIEQADRGDALPPSVRQLQEGLAFHVTPIAYGALENAFEINSTLSAPVGFLEVLHDVIDGVRDDVVEGQERETVRQSGLAIMLVPHSARPAMG